MAKYFISWEVNESYTPVDPKERAALISRLIDMTRKGIEAGKTTDWGIFLGGTMGYSISNANAQELYQNLMQFNPFIRFEVQEVLTLDDLEQVVKAMAG